MRPDLSMEWADLRIERVELRPKSPQRPKKANLRLEGPCLMPDFSPERPNGVDNWTNKWTTGQMLEQVPLCSTGLYSLWSHCPKKLPKMPIFWSFMSV